MSKKQRLPRRYDRVLKTLYKLMETGSAKTQEAAALRVSEILLQHDRSQERVAIATERAAARRAEAIRPSTVTPLPDEVGEGQGNPPQPIPDDPYAKGKAFLAEFMKPKGSDDATT